MDAKATSSMNLPVRRDRSVGNMAGTALGEGVRSIAPSKRMFLTGIVFLTVLLIFFYYMDAIARAEKIQARRSGSCDKKGFVSTIANFTSGIRHHRCKRKGGCCATCPYTSEDDPRATMSTKAGVIKNAYELAKTSLEEEESRMQMMLDRLNETDRDVVATELDVAKVQMRNCVSNLSSLASKAQDIETMHGSTDGAIVSDAINAANKMTGLEAAASINVDIFMMCIMRSGSYLMDYRVIHMTPEEMNKIANYDTKAYTSSVATGRIKDSFNTYAAKTAVSGEYTANVDMLLNVDSSSSSIVSALAFILNMNKEIHATLRDLAANFASVQEVFSTSAGRVESFTNDLPGQITNDSVNNMIANDDYSTAALLTAIEPELISSHKKFAKERSTFESGSGMVAVRDDDNDVIPWAGLFGRPTYRKSNGSSAQVSAEPLRAIPSTDADQNMRTNVPRMTM